jgi:gliding motility-associated-like protein
MNKLYILIISILLIPSVSKSQCEILASQTEICEFQELTLHVESGDPSTTYTWDIGGDGSNIIEGDTAIFSLDFVEGDSLFNIILLANNTPCNSIDIQVNNAPVIQIGVPFTSNVGLVDNLLKSCVTNDAQIVKIFNFAPLSNPVSSYEVDWGDGTIETYAPEEFSPISTIQHEYSAEGYYDIVITGISSENSCNTVEEYTFYKGSNPAIGFATPGNTVGLCAPATVDFPILNYLDNPTGTEYKVFVNGDEVAFFDQTNIPAIYSHTFDDSSCGLSTSTGNYLNAYDIQIIAINPCNSSSATIEPIEISEGPSPEILFDTTITCTEQVITFINNTAVLEVVGGNPSECLSELAASWNIQSEDGSTTGYEIVAGSPFGSNEIEVSFLEPGTYFIEMSVNSPSCGIFATGDTIVIEEPPTTYFEIDDLNGSAGTTENPCAPFGVFIDNSSIGDSLIYLWDITTDGTFELGDGYSTDSEDIELLVEDGGEINIALSAENTCASVSWDTTFLIASPPALTLAPLPDGCLGLELNLEEYIAYENNGNPITSYQWTFTDHPTGSSIDSIPALLEYNTPGQYSIEIFAENACGGNTVSDTFFIQELTSLTMPADTTVCSNNNAINLEAFPEGGIWTGSGIVGQSSFDPNASGAGTFELNYAYGLGECNTNENITIEVLPVPVIATDDQVVCASQDSIFLEATPAGGVWSPMSVVFFNDSIFYPEQNGSGTYNFEYTYTGTNGCNNSSTSTIQVNALPQVSVDNATFCLSPESLSLPVASPNGGLFNGPGLVNGNQFNASDAGGIGIYTLNYTYTDQNMCTDSMSFTVEVIEAGSINAGEDNILCIDQGPFELDGFTPANGIWSGNGITNPNGIFDPSNAGAGTHVLNYMIGSGSCELMDEITIDVIDLTNVQAGPNLEVCNNEEAFQLEGASVSGGTWQGAGITDPVNGIFDPIEAGAGTHIISYTIAELGCSSFAERTIIVHPNPVTDFEINSPPCINSVVNFTNNTTDAVSYNWKFGNALFSTEENPSTNYSSEGNYDVQLIASSGFGCKDTLVLPVEIVSAPDIEFTLNQEVGCDGFILEPTDQTIAFDPQYNWDFGNGQTSAQQIPDFDVIYPASLFSDTNYVVTLTVSNICGSESLSDSILIHPYPVAEFGFMIDTVCDPYQVQFENVSYGEPLSYFWDFGNDSLSTEPFPGEQLYDVDTLPIDYPITLIAENSCGADTITQFLTVSPIVVNSNFNTSSAIGCPPFEVNFDDYSTPGVFIEWDFGDGNVSTIENPVHTFDSTGIYLVKQYVNNGCATDSSEIEITVLEAPEVSFESTGPFCSNQAVEFSNTSLDLSGSQWYFGSIDSSNLVNPSFLFPEPGNYTVTLIGTKNDSGCKSTFTDEITVFDFPEASFAFNGAEGCIPLSVSFDNQSQGATYYLWDFGDGNTSISALPQHVYESAGTFNPSLTSTDTNGCSDTSVFNIVTAYPLPGSDFEMTLLDSCGIPAEVQFTEQSTNASGFEWNFNNTDLTNLNNPSYTFNQAGVQNISLISFTQFNCRDTISKTIELFEQPFSDFELEPVSDCQPVTFQPVSTAFNAESYVWMIGDSVYNEGGLNPIITIEEAGTYDISLITGNMDMCFDTLTLESEIEVLLQPTANFTWVENPEGQPQQSIQFISLSENADQHNWDLGDGTLTTEINPIHRYFEGQAVDIRLNVVNNNGCEADTLLNIVPPLFGSLYVPNAFTPDYGNQEATIFLPKGIGLSEYRLQIFSTYGQLLWETSLLHDGSPAEGWDGTYNGQDLPQDTYVWKVYAVFQDGREWVGTETKNGKILKIGTVLLLR